MTARYFKPTQGYPLHDGAEPGAARNSLEIEKLKRALVGSFESIEGAVTGASPYTVTLARFVQPSGSANVTVLVGNTSWATASANVYVPTGGYYTVANVINSTAMTITNSGTSGNAPAGTVIAELTPVSLSGTGATGGAGTVQSAGVATAQNTSSTTYVDLTTAGPSVTLTTGTTVTVMVTVACYRGGVAFSAFCAIDVSGATTVAAADANGTYVPSYVGMFPLKLARVCKMSGLTAGSNTFKLQYRCDGGGPWAFLERDLTVIAP